jgi:hypothetical protein
MEYGLGGALSMYGQMYNAYKFLIGKPEGKKLLRIPISFGRIIIKRILRE